MIAPFHILILLATIYMREYIYIRKSIDMYQFNGELIVIFALNGISNDPAIEIYI